VVIPLTVVKCCKQSPAICVINKLRPSHSVDNTCGVTRRESQTVGRSNVAKCARILKVGAQIPS